MIANILPPCLKNGFGVNEEPSVGGTVKNPANINVAPPNIIIGPTGTLDWFEIVGFGRLRFIFVLGGASCENTLVESVKANAKKIFFIFSINQLRLLNIDLVQV